MNDQSQDYGYPPYGSDSRPSSTPPAHDAAYHQPAAAPANPTEGRSEPTSAVNPQPWGQPAWGQPTWGSQPASDWPQAHDGQDHGYPKPDNPGQGYPLSQYTQWANVKVPTPEYGSSLKQSNRGVVALSLALAALGISVLLSVWGGRAWLAADRLTNGAFEVDNPPPGTEGLATTMSYSVVGQLLPSLLGFIGLILGISGVRTTSRGASIAAIIVAILAPLLSFLIFVVISSWGMI